MRSELVRSEFEQQNWLELSAIQIGGALSLPMLVIGFELSKQGWQIALSAICIGNLVLFALALLMGDIATQTRCTTSENAAHYFGKRGKELFSLVLIVSMSFWFAIQSQLIAEKVSKLFCLAEPRIWSAVISLAIVVSALKGIRWLAQLAKAVVPLMVATLALSLFLNYSETRQEATCSASLVGAVSLVLAGAMLAVIDLPTFFRHAKTKRDAKLASVATFLVAIPLIEMVGVLIGLFSGKEEFTDALTASNYPLFGLWIGVFVLLSGWTTNNANLYSGAMSLQTVYPRLSNSYAIGAVGLLAIALSYCDILSKLSFVLELMAVVIASYGSVVLTGHLIRFNSSSNLLANLLAWLSGALFGLLSLMGYASVTPIAILDACLGAILSTLLLRRIPSEKNV